MLLVLLPYKYSPPASLMATGAPLWSWYLSCVQMPWVGLSQPSASPDWERSISFLQDPFPGLSFGFPPVLAACRKIWLTETQLCMTPHCWFGMESNIPVSLGLTTASSASLFLFLWVEHQFWITALCWGGLWLWTDFLRHTKYGDSNQFYWPPPTGYWFAISMPK